MIEQLWKVRGQGIKEDERAEAQKRKEQGAKKRARPASKETEQRDL